MSLTRSRLAQLLLLSAILLPLPSRADIFQWEIGPAGQRASATLCPDGAGAVARPDADLSGRNLTKAFLFRDNLIGADLSDSDLTDAFLVSATLSGAQLKNAILVRTMLDYSNLTNADLSDAIITEARFQGCTGVTLQQIYSTNNYRSGDLHGISFSYLDFTGGIFADKNLSGSTFGMGSLAGADLRGANLNAADLYVTNAAGSNFADATMINARLSGANFTSASFTSADLTGVFMDWAKMTDADLTDAHITGANFRKAEGLTAQQLSSTASYKEHDLRGISLQEHKLVGWDLGGQNLGKADLEGADLDSVRLAGADLSDAKVFAAKLTETTALGFTANQLYSTYSYKSHDLRQIELWGNDLSGWNFSGRDLTNANLSLSNASQMDLTRANLSYTDFHRSTLHGTDFRDARLDRTKLQGADLRGALNLTPTQLASAVTTNTILPDGTISGLDVEADGIMLIRNHPLPIEILSHATFDPSATLQIALSPDWTSTISFEPGIPVTLGGDLELFFAEGFTRADLAGKTFKLFDWTGVTPSGQFTLLDPSSWDASRLYIDGTVTLIPEPSSIFLLSPLVLLIRHRVHRAHRA